MRVSSVSGIFVSIPGSTGTSKYDMCDRCENRLWGRDSLGMNIIQQVVCAVFAMTYFEVYQAFWVHLTYMYIGRDEVHHYEGAAVALRLCELGSAD